MLRKLSLWIGLLWPTVVPHTCAQSASLSTEEHIIAVERLALDRWSKGHPEGYLAIYAPDITYFDPHVPSRVDGLTAITALYRSFARKIRIDRYQMNNTSVQRIGDAAVLTFNLVTHAKDANGKVVISRWNSSEVYRRLNGAWKIVHSHWSLTGLAGQN